MYIYHALINALSAHMIHINLNMIFYTHVKHSPTKTVYVKYYHKNTKVNMVLNVHRNRTAYYGRGEGVMEVGEEGDYIPIATLSPPEWFLH